MYPEYLTLDTGKLSYATIFKITSSFFLVVRSNVYPTYLYRITARQLVCHDKYQEMLPHEGRSPSVTSVTYSYPQCVCLPGMVITYFVCCFSPIEHMEFTVNLIYGRIHHSTTSSGKGTLRRIA